MVWTRVEIHILLVEELEEEVADTRRVLVGDVLVGSADEGATRCLSSPSRLSGTYYTHSMNFWVFSSDAILPFNVREPPEMASEGQPTSAEMSVFPASVAALGLSLTRNWAVQSAAPSMVIPEKKACVLAIT